jgi:hypothetical protein
MRATVAKDFFKTFDRLNRVHQQFFSGDNLRAFAHKLGYCESTDYPDGPLGLSGWLFFIRISGSHIISGWSGI